MPVVTRLATFLQTTLLAMAALVVGAFVFWSVVPMNLSTREVTILLVFVAPALSLAVGVAAAVRQPSDAARGGSALRRATLAVLAGVVGYVAAHVAIFTAIALPTGAAGAARAASDLAPISQALAWGVGLLVGIAVWFRLRLRTGASR